MFATLASIVRFFVGSCTRKPTAQPTHRTPLLPHDDGAVPETQSPLESQQPKQFAGPHGSMVPQPLTKRSTDTNPKVSFIQPPEK
jgi:hypothetical protein